MTKSEQSKKDSFWRKIPVVSTVLKRWDFYKITRDSLRWHRDKHDPKELAKTMPPDTENIELHCVWVSEAYSPSNINRLIATLKKLGWDTPEKNIGERESLTGWIRQGRSFGLGSSWKNGGIILSRGDNARFFGSDIRRAKLPHGVEYGYLSIRNITSSLTLVTIQFVLNDEAAASLNTPFNGTYRTKVEYRPSMLNSKGAAYIGAVEQKRRAIQKELDIIHSNFHDWFRKNLPGYFASLGTGDFPTIDLITSRLYEQPSDEDKKFKEHYTDLMFDYGVEIWKCKTDSNLELRLPCRRADRPIAALFGNYDKLTENNETYGGKNRSGLVNKLHLAFGETMALWTTQNLLLSYESQLSGIRDRASFQTKGTGAAISFPTA